MFVLGMRELYPSISRPGKVVGHGHYFSTLSRRNRSRRPEPVESAGEFGHGKH